MALLGNLGKIPERFLDARVALTSRQVVGREQQIVEHALLSEHAMSFDHVHESGLGRLARACATGDTGVFEEMYRTHGERMKSIAYNHLGNISDEVCGSMLDKSRDAAQTAFDERYPLFNQPEALSLPPALSAAGLANKTD